jgi:glycosyltransferase involved in cell wall biosynthesis
VITHDISPTILIGRAGRVLNLLQGYGGHDPLRIGFGRTYLRRQAQKLADRAGPADFLHFGSSHLPIARPAPGQRHFLFTDYGIHILCENGLYKSQTNKRFRAAALRAEAEMVASLDGLFLTADYVARSFVEKMGVPASKATRVGSGLNRDIPLPSQKQFAAGYILFVAKRNFVDKGGLLLLDAFDCLRAQMPEARLVIIGNRSDPSQAPHLARMEGTAGIAFHDFDTPEFQQLVAGAALYAGPATDEPWGIIYLESLAAGTPIAGLARNAFPQFAGDGAYGFISKDERPETFAALLADALSDPERLARMGAAGREHVLAEYSWDKVAERIAARLRHSPRLAA